MSVGWKRGLVLLAAMAIVVLLIFDTSVFAQCAMCKASLAGSNNTFFIRSFNIAILVLLVPPVTIFCSIFVVLKRYKANNAGPDDELQPAREADKN